MFKLPPASELLRLTLNEFYYLISDSFFTFISLFFPLKGSGIFVILFGSAYFGHFHCYPYFIMVQIGVGVFEVR